MALTPWDKLLTSLQNKEIVLPHLEAAILSEKWPDEFTVRVDSRPYYGKGDGYFHPSSHPLMGARQLYYLFHPDHQSQLIPERRDTTSHMILEVGSALHAITQTKMLMTGLVASEKDIEVEFVNTEHHVRGRTDMICTLPGQGRVMVEIKTINPWALKKLDGGLKPSWEAQMSLAMDALGFDTGVLLAVESGFPFHMHEIPVRRNDELLVQIYEKFDYVRAAIAANEPPRPCCAFGSDEMKACPARSVCWS